MTLTKWAECLYVSWRLESCREVTCSIFFSSHSSPPSHPSLPSHPSPSPQFSVSSGTTWLSSPHSPTLPPPSPPCPLCPLSPPSPPPAPSCLRQKQPRAVESPLLETSSLPIGNTKETSQKSHYFSNTVQ